MYDLPFNGSADREQFGELNAKRIVDIFKRSPDHEKSKYFLVMDAAKRLNDQDKMKRMALFHGIESPLQSSRNIESAISNYVERIGVRPADWSLEFKENTDYKDKIYNPGTEDQATNTIEDLVAGNLLKDLAETNQKIKPFAEQAQSDENSRDFGARLSCLDPTLIPKEMVGPKTLFCSTLREQNNYHLASLKKKTAVSRHRRPRGRNKFLMLSRSLISIEKSCSQKAIPILRRVSLEEEILRKVAVRIAFRATNECPRI